MSSHFRVLIVDDHAHAREGMREILAGDPDFEVIGEADSAEQALEFIDQWMPDLILMDIRMKGMDGLEATKIIKERYPYVKIVMVTVSDNITHLFEALKKGAQGYLIKNLQPSAWLEYLRAIALDEAPMTRELAFRILKEFSGGWDAESVVSGGESSQQSEQVQGKVRASVLTMREREILERVAKGESNRVISERLGIAENTVKNHLKNIMQKLHMENRVQLTRYAYEQGLIE